MNKKQLKCSWRGDCKGCILATAVFHTWLVGLKITKSVYKIILYLYQYIDKIYVNKKKHYPSLHNAGPQGSPLLSTNVAVSPLYGLTVVSWEWNKSI